MSLYTFATTNFTIESDLRRRAFVDGGQLVRTMALFVLVLATLVLAAPHSDAGDDRARFGWDAPWVSPPTAHFADATAAPRLHRSLPAARF